MENTTSHADWFSCPGDSLVAAMQRRGVAASDLAGRLSGGMAQLRGLVSGLEPIDPESAAVIGLTVGGSIEFWLKRQENYELALERAVASVPPEEATVWLSAIPAPGPAARGKLNDDRRNEELRRRLAFFAVGTLGAWQGRYGAENRQARFRTSLTFSSHEGPTSLWLREAELEATIADTAVWNPEALEARLREIKKLSFIRRPGRFLPLLKKLLAEAGVALVIKRTPQGCRASGASRMITPERAMILLSFRYRSDEQFWFTLFHEIGHLLLHGARAFVDEDEMPDDACEDEANAFAASLVVPPHMERDFESLPARHKDITRFAILADVAPGLVRGQMEHRGRIPPFRLTFLRRNWTWAEIDEAIASL
ncbi:ImmA/IrrE family metallo-endopeptidase [Sphingopyxis sp. YF1]|uniref:ImmA/IrrE family metallo-endopeptidase n=1 Tax=Sphingopyxis sp. YF1 TaxID=2482763 RepID=UPI001F616AE4|nr:ImmA/IrrE family metallo-endopeptidase [Sphingopyxis sp. YF1]UNU44530.1 ImmA/IrrE family metallo-endopeptidase [Sphingopyxis sp. YF1]